MSFFKKGEASQEQANGLLFAEHKGSGPLPEFGGLFAGAKSDEWAEETTILAGDDDGGRYNEQAGPVKRLRTDRYVRDDPDETAIPLESDITNKEVTIPTNGAGSSEAKAADCKASVDQRDSTRQQGPFVNESDSETEDVTLPKVKKEDSPDQPSGSPLLNERGPARTLPNAMESEKTSSFIKPERSNTENIASADFEGFEGNDESDMDEFEGEEYQARRWMEEQHLLELEAEQDQSGAVDHVVVKQEITTENNSTETVAGVTCPLCNAELHGLSDQEASVHVNNCLDGNSPPSPKPKAEKVVKLEHSEINTAVLAKRFSHVLREPKPGQANPFAVGSTPTGSKSAFSKMMSGHAEDAAWADAAAAENAARGKPAYQRTCPFYKIIPGFSICVDAFRYGAVAGCEAYFLSHFHSDHYVGLTSTWCHGPIYCSRVTGNLVKQQLRVDPKYVIALEFEKPVEIPRTGGAKVTMIPANHCPGSSLYLFEKKLGAGNNSRNQRILHCGDFRACRAHIEHPLLCPESMDDVLKKSKQQKIDVCYLDTTYLNPKYAFPSQEEVIQACADMCVSLSKDLVDESDNWETAKREREGGVMAKFIRSDSDFIKQEHKDDGSGDSLQATQVKGRGRLLVIVGTYSIGKERICMGIAKALNSKIYAPPGKQRICNCLEDPELSARLTSDPREAQVHMTPLFEIRAETLGDYLKDYRQYFSRAVGFRPSGWNYRPPNTRFLESPSVQTVLYSQNWKSTYTMRELVPQRGSTSRASCFGVPYSEHSSFRELTMFCCALRIDRIIPTVNVGSAKSRERMKAWAERWALDRKKNGLFQVEKDGKVFW